ncbi:MAG: hypothetical protein HYZ57_18870 [Acidobacteria bacterium]|nr:hypothetical protein [Acidobacteriota bacterium]MBI3281893.1 hypothetical protein [Acidobacteriota bacterium]
MSLKRHALVIASPVGAVAAPDEISRMLDRHYGLDLRHVCYLAARADRMQQLEWELSRRAAGAPRERALKA